MFLFCFWEKNSLDRINGGYFSCLNRERVIYDTDKFIWLQGRQAWMYSFLFNQVENKQSWLEIAKSGIGFLRSNAMDHDGNFYYFMDVKGNPSQ